MSFDDLFHPLHGQGYQFWSGIGSDLGELSILIAITAFVWGWYRVHNCHVKGCKSILTHPDPAHGWPACRRHHSMNDSLGADPHA